jgi:hypothetical protein
MGSVSGMLCELGDEFVIRIKSAQELRSSTLSPALIPQRARIVRWARRGGQSMFSHTQLPRIPFFRKSRQPPLFLTYCD